jgi:HEAT repeat protein
MRARPRRPHSGRIGLPGPIGELIRVAEEDPVGWVRSWAIAALGDLDAPVAARIAKLLVDPDWKVRRSSLVALAQLGDTDTLAEIRAAASRETWRRRGHYRRAIRAVETSAES